MTSKKNIDQDLLENVERYNANSMTIAERALFEDKINTDLDFKNQVDYINKLIQGIELRTLKEKLDDFHVEVSASDDANHKTKTMHNWFLKIVAAAIVIIGFGSLFYFNSTSNDKLYKKYFITDPGLPTVMGNSKNYEFYEAMVNYKRKEYKTAISKWEKMAHTNANNDTINYFLGVAHMANGQQELAIDYLNKVTKQSSSKFQSEAYFYLGLAYLKINELNSAKSNLKQSKMDNSNALLKQLNE